MASRQSGTQPDKSIWDKASVIIQGIGALAIPISIFVLIIQIMQFNAQQQLTQQQALDQQQQATLQTYFDDMTKLLFDDKLGSQTVADKATSTEAAIIARAKTLTVLRSLTDPQRKARVLRFLYEAGLIKRPKNNGDKANPILDISGADLSRADLNGVDLSDADLYSVNLSGANLSKATLDGADLRYSDLSSAHLEHSNLIGTDLECSNLEGAFLNGAATVSTNFKGANLKGADAHLSDDELKSLGVKPDGTGPSTTGCQFGGI